MTITPQLPVRRKAYCVLSVNSLSHALLALSSQLKRLYLETSHFVAEARRYRDMLSAASAWLDLWLHCGDARRAGACQELVHRWRQALGT